MRMHRLTLTNAPPPLVEELRPPCAGAPWISEDVGRDIP
jgi:hypothetical protein